MNNEPLKPLRGLGLRIHRAFGTERLIMLEELGGVHYVVIYKPRHPNAARHEPSSMTERVGFESEFCREGYAVVWETKIEPAEAEEMFKLLRREFNPEPPHKMFGVDGVTYELFWDNGREGVSGRQAAVSASQMQFAFSDAEKPCHCNAMTGPPRYEWWGQAPPEWAPLEEVAERLRRHMVFTGFD